MCSSPFLTINCKIGIHVVLLPWNRIKTSEAKNTAKQFLYITNVMLLAAAKKEVDKIVLESVRIVSGLESDVPIFVEKPRLSGAIPLPNHLTNSELQQRAAKQVNEILL